MRYQRIAGMLALLLALALTLACAAEELGEIDLYDPSIYLSDGQAGEAPGAGYADDEPEWVMLDPETSEPLPDAPAPEPEPAAPAPEPEPAPEAEDDPAGADCAETVAPESASEEEMLAAAMALAAEAGDGQPQRVLGVGETWTLDGAAMLPAGSAILGYFSTDASVAAVDRATGLVTAAGVGRAEIVVVSEAGAAAIFALEVRKAPERLSFAQSRLYKALGETAALELQMPPDAASSRIDYVSSDPLVCAVDAQGVASCLSLGSAKITATAFNGVKASCVVTVLDGQPPTTLMLDVKSLKLGLGETFALSPAVGEGEAATFTFSSTNARVAEVSEEGVITAAARGSAKVVVKTANGLKAIVRVKVVKAPTSIAFEPKKCVLNVGTPAALPVKLSKGSASQLTWKCSKAGIVSMDADGTCTPLAAGTLKVSATTYNGLRAACRVIVLAGAAPTKLKLNAKTVKLGEKGQFALAPEIGEGEEARFTYATSDKRVAKVSSKGVITAKARGTATVTVRTHNGLEASVTVKVYKAPTRIVLSETDCEMIVGTSMKLKAKLPGGAYSKITWSSDAPEVAAVDAKGNVSALQPGEALITAATYNGVTAGCAVTVVPEPPEIPELQQMLDNLRADTSLGLGGKREAVVGVIELLATAGYEPAFAAGVAANVYSEGTYGLFESSKYVSHPEKRPRYFAYLDGGDYYTRSGDTYVVTDVYLSPEEYEVYDGDANAHLRFGEKDYYLDNYSKKYATEVDLYELEALLQALSDGGWQGKFGLGVVQWTGGRTKKLVECYRRQAGSAATLTMAQVIAAENEMILGEFNGGYSYVYAAWQRENEGDPATADAAYSAGAIVCLKYEVPADRENKARTRGQKAADIYRVMVGE